MDAYKSNLRDLSLFQTMSDMVIPSLTQFDRLRQVSAPQDVYILVIFIRDFHHL